MRLDSIDTRHGTLNKVGYSNGNTLPYTGTPFGMNYFVLQSQNDSNWFFDPTYPLIQGFRLTHQPSPWMGDYSWMVFSPISGEPRDTELTHLQSSYKLDEAVFQPHKMEIESLRYRLKTTVVPTKRGARFKIERGSDKTLGLVLSSGEEVQYKIDQKSNRVIGILPQKVNNGQNNLQLFFAIEFENINHTDLSINIFKSNQWNTETTANSKTIWLSIATEKETVECSIGTSFISEEQAILNLDREAAQYSTAQLIEQSSNEWSQYLDRIKVKDRNKAKERNFDLYMYRMFLFPQTYYERNHLGESVHFDSYSETIKKGKFFTNNGFWDTYRTVYPLYSLIAPEKYKEILEGIRHFYNESGHLPKWLSPDERGLMPGTLINAVIADASSKHLLDEETSKFFLEAMVKEATVSSNDPRFGRAGVTDMKQFGYVTDDEIENVNQTQDNAYSDFCIFQVAENIGNHKIAEEFKKEALNYRNLFDSETGFLRGKNTSGNFSKAFIPEDWGFNYTEGSAWQNALAFYHDNQGYIDLLGGNEQFLKHLTNLANTKPIFEIGNYGMEIHEISELATNNFGQIAISNQPSFHIPYLYSYAGKPEYTQHLVKQLCMHAFSDGFEGFPGDEDNGSMSGWYIFSHLGFYPVTPGRAEYVLGIPQFDEMIIKLQEGKELKISVDGNYPQNSFVQKVLVNNIQHDAFHISHKTILEGGNMKIQLGILPNIRKFTKEHLPYSLSHDII
ncbi:GH92 family glycosyl hydrolase [Marinilactibacillus sp. XAAS-LB27]|uniref:GH92 family glycosyl hydrolase n=1 Tax=Marinilactibacillus sp. XAAS-LB27 TaxID=3114538 RepID=UPI002E16F39D|nr:GH92 family glycosyl hydrolase [Marinilactibacillus sp. XAAS-LB27]